MRVRVEEAGACRRVLHVEVPADTVAPERESVLKAFAGRARIPGFRVGRAPLSVVERHFDREVLQETQERLVPRFYREAMKSQGIEPVAVVDVRNVRLDKTTGLAFRVTVDVAPDFRLPKYEKIPVSARKAEVEEEAVDRALDRIRESFARYTDVSGRASRAGDLVRVDYSGTLDGKRIADAVPGCAGLGEGKDFWVLLGEPEFLPGFSKALAGMQAGERKTIAVAFTPDYHVPGVAGKQAAYDVLVKGIRERALPEMNAEFLGALQAESVEALRNRVRGDLLAAANRSETQRRKDEAARYLLDRADFDLPQSLVERQTGLAVRGMVRQIALRGGTREQITARSQEIVSAAAKTSAERVKLSYVLDGIAREEKIEVSEADVDAQIRFLAERHGMTPERLRAELEEADGMDRLRAEIRAEKALDFVLEHAKLKEEEQS